MSATDTATLPDSTRRSTRHADPSLTSHNHTSWFFSTTG